MALEVEWDDAKAAYNLRKHGVSFEDAMWVFADPGRVELLDDREDYGEDRWMTIGRADPALLVVVHTVRGREGSVIRIISARKANPSERGYYRETQA